jgi:glutathione S-transferase
MLDSQKLILYGSVFSGASHSVEAFFKANKIVYDFKEVNLFTGEQKSDLITKLNPLQKVPILIEGDLILRESMVFSRYIANSRKVSDFWYPKDPEARALVDLGLEYWSQNQPNLHRVALNFFGVIPGTKEESSVIFHKAVEDFEKIFLKKSKFVAGDKLTLADLPYVFHVFGQKFFTGEDFSEHKRYNEWIQDVFKAEPLIKQQIEKFQETVKKSQEKK